MSESINNNPPLRQENSSQEVSIAPKNVFLLNKQFLYIVGIFLLLFVFLTFLTLKLNFANRKNISTAEYLSIVSHTPFVESKSTKPRIVMKFNFPVEAHHAEEFFYLSPFVEGQLVQGSGPNEIVYEPKVSFPAGARVAVTLKSGLPSESGRRLANDYSFFFDISHDSGSVVFTNNDMAGKFMSFQRSKGADITLKVGSEIAEPKVVVYKANLNLLLQNMTYIKDTNYGSPNEGQYAEEVVDTKNLKEVKQYVDVKDGDKLNFEGDLGLYLFQALEGTNVISSVWVSLNDTGIHLRQDDKKVYLAAQNLESGSTEDGIDLKFYQMQMEPRTLATHTLSNIQEYPFDISERLDLVVGIKGNEIIIVPVALPNSQAEIRSIKDLNRKYQIFVYTDRPVYRKGAEVSYRGVVREDNDAIYLRPGIKKVRVYSTNSSSGFIFDELVDVGENGVFYGVFEIPKELIGNYFSFSVTTNLDKGKQDYQGGASFEVYDYIKPEFGLDVAIDDKEYIKSEQIPARIFGKYFNGTPYANKKVNVTVFSKDYYETEKAVYNSSFRLNGWGGMCGGGGFGDEYYGQVVQAKKEIELDDKGEAEIIFNTGDLVSSLSQDVTFLVEKIDSSGNSLVGAKSAIVHQGEFNVFYRPSPSRIDYNSEFKIPFYAENLNGQKLGDKKFQYEIYFDEWNADNNKSDRNVIKAGEVLTNEDGSGMVIDKVENNSGNLDSKYYYIAVSSKDNLGNRIETRKGVLFVPQSPQFSKYYDPEIALGQTLLKITSLKSSLNFDDEAELLINSPADMKVFVTFERGRVYTPQWLELKKGENTFKFKVISEYMPSISPTFSLFYDGQYYIEGLSLNVPALSKLVNVTLNADKEKYKIGDTAILTITTKDDKGNLIPSDVGVGIVDKAIYALRKDATSPIHSSFYFFRGRNVNTSSSLTWIATYNWGGRGGGGGGGETFLKDTDTLFWNPNLKTGTDGTVKVEVPVGDTKTTWRVLVYASTEDTKLGQESLDFLVGSN